MREIEKEIMHLLKTQAFVAAALIIVVLLLVNFIFSYSTGKGFFATLFSAQRTIAGARLDVPNDAPDFGTVSQIETKKVTVSNKGTDILSFSEARSSCACLSVELPQSGIAPRKSTALTVTLDPAKASKGRQTFIVTLYSNARDHSEYDLVVSATIK